MPAHDRSGFKNLYAGQAPWDIDRPQKAFLDVTDRITGSVLHAGCGTGENTMYFAGRGCTVTGINFLELLIHQARRKAAQRHMAAPFLLNERAVRHVTDSGLFFVVGDEAAGSLRVWQRYRKQLSPSPGVLSGGFGGG